MLNRVSQISEIHLLVHPDYHAMGMEFKGFHPVQVKMRNGWKARVQQIKGRSSSALVYISALNEDEVQRGFTDSMSLVPENNILARDEIYRIQNWQSLLKERFIRWPNTRITEALIARFRQNGLVFDPRNTDLYVFGEYLDSSPYGPGKIELIGCVDVAGDDAKRVLGIPDDHYHTVQELSLSYEEHGREMWETWDYNKWRSYRKGKEF